MSKKRFSWAVFRPRRRSVPAALLKPVPKSTKAITMPSRNMRVLSDAECGLPDDPVAQQAAETYLAAWIGWTLKQAEKAQDQAAKVMAVEVPMDDASLSILDVPADVLDGISAELRRISKGSARKPVSGSEAVIPLETLHARP